MVQFVTAPPPQKKILLVFSFSPILKSSRRYWIIAQQNQAPTLSPGQDSYNQLLFSLQWPGLNSLASASVFFSVTQARFLPSLLLIFSLQSFMLVFLLHATAVFERSFPFFFSDFFCKFKAVIFLNYWIILTIGLFWLSCFKVYMLAYTL